jgi:predicted  nucleic acid-binding Zn-ribbon protein
LIVEKDRTIQQLRVDESSFDVDLDRLRQELNFVKENYQRLTYESLEKGDQISRLTLQIAAANNNNNQIEARLSEELSEIKRKYDRLSSECAIMENSLRSAEEDRIFH